MPQSITPPDPARPLGSTGLALWSSIWQNGDGRSLDAEMVLRVCERADEHAALRFKVIRDGDWRERAALRALDTQMARDFAALGYTPNDSNEASARRELDQMPHVAGTLLATSLISIAKEMDRKTTSLLAKEMRETLAELKAIDIPTIAEASDLDSIRARRAERRSS